MVKITEDKLLAFEAFFQNYSNRKAITFTAFNEPQDDFNAKSICELLEEKDGATKLLMYFSN